jgi:hypothetical protein
MYSAGRVPFSTTTVHTVRAPPKERNLASVQIPEVEYSLGMEERWEKKTSHL